MSSIKTILVVDDDVAILEVLKIVLEEEGYHVITDTGYKAIQIVESQNPDLLLLDIWMRGLDGREVSRQIKTTTNLSAIPIVLMSAHSHVDTAVDEAGADGFIEKPFDIDAMLQVIKEYV